MGVLHAFLHHEPAVQERLVICQQIPAPPGKIRQLPGLDGSCLIGDSQDPRILRRCGAQAEITRFKGLGEISADEFKEFIGERMRLDRVRLTKDDPIHDMLEFYMGKNSPERQGFIVDNLRIEEDLIEGDLQPSGE